MPARSARKDWDASQAEEHWEYCHPLAALGWDDCLEQGSGASVASRSRVGGVGGLLSREQAVRAA